MAVISVALSAAPGITARHNRRCPLSLMSISEAWLFDRTGSCIHGAVNVGKQGSVV